jgi:hypothetical protein
MTRAVLKRRDMAITVYTRSQPRGARIFSRQFGWGMIVKEGPEQCEVTWDDESFKSPMIVPVKWFDKRYRETLKQRSSV